MTPRESYSDRMTFLLQGGDAVRQATEGTRAFADGRNLTADELARLCIVIEELVVNLYDHGGLTKEDQVELILAGEPGAIRVTIVDPGVPFDPRSAPMEQDNAERGGGAGIGIVRTWARIVEYDVTDAGNRLELLVPLGLLGGPAAGQPPLSRRR